MNSATTRLSVSLLSAAITLGACTSGSSNHHHAGTAGQHGSPAADAGYPTGGSGDEIVLYRWSTGHLVRYSTGQRAITFETTAPQTFQYVFSARSGLYTSGDSVAYGFKLLETGGGDIRTVLRADGAKGLFPVARTVRETIVSLVDYDASGRISGSRLARVNGGKLDILAELAASPLGGAIIGNRLYFTTAAGGAGNTYDLLAMDLDATEAQRTGSTEQTGARFAEPSRVRSGLTKPRIYAANGSLIVDGRMDGRDISFPCAYECATEDTGRWLFSLRPDQNQDLMLEVYSLRSGTAVWSTTGDVVDYRLDGENLTVYLNGGIAEHRLEVSP